MPLTAAAGSIALAESYLGVMLSRCAAFRTFCGVATEALALARIYHTSLPQATGERYTAEELSGYRPFALIATAPTEGLRRTVDSTDSFDSRGRITLRLERDVASADAANPQEAERKFLNEVGGIIDELCGRAAPGAAGELAFDAITLASGPWRPPVEAYEEQGDYIACELAVEWEE